MKKTLTTAIVIMLVAALFVSCKKKEAPAAKTVQAETTHSTLVLLQVQFLSQKMTFVVLKNLLNAMEK